MYSQIIKKFLDNYVGTEGARYEKSCDFCADFCRKTLKQQGIKAIVTSRIKDVESLKNKLKVKESERGHGYKNIKEIIDEINDLAGVRIALYFPDDYKDVEKIISESFKIEKSKTFPIKKEVVNQNYEKVFSGYQAAHFIVRQKTENLEETQKNLLDCKIEIQVASVLMHAWAEVEHDLIYKPLNGQISIEEKQILDEINGLVLAGDLALRRLQSASTSRSKEMGIFSDEYNLRTFLNRYILNNNPSIKKYTIGRSDILFEFIKLAKLNSPDKIETYLKYVNFEDEIAEQIIVQILKQFPDFDKKYKEAIKNIKPFELHDKNSDEYYKDFADIFSNWANFQKIVYEHTKNIDNQLAPYNKSISQIQGVYSDILGSNLLEQIERVRNTRNVLAHSINRIDLQKINKASKESQEIIDRIKEKLRYIP